MRTLCHYTVTTGDIRRSPRSEVTIDLDVLAPLLTTGTHEIDWMPGYTFRTTVDGGVLLCTVAADGIPLVTAGVARDQAGLDVLRDLLGVPAGADVWAPAVIARLELSIVLAGPESVGWLGDWERCIGWAWIEQGG